MFDRFGDELRIFGKELDIKLITISEFIFFKDFYLLSPTGSLRV